MLRTTKRLSSTLVHSPRSPMSFFKTILHIVRTALNRVRWEENQQFTALEQRSSTVPKNAEQATQLFVATEKQIALSEEGRLQRIDQVHCWVGRFWVPRRTSTKEKYITRE